MSLTPKEIPIGAVIGMCNSNGRVDEGVTFLTERMLVRNVDQELSSMLVYRGYGKTEPVTIDLSVHPYIVQYGCGFNFTVQHLNQNTNGEGGYTSGEYEFAQSFVYDGDQESLLRTKKDMICSGTLTKLTIPEHRNFCKLSIVIGAFGPYSARITGGRIYIREIGSEEPWALLADINLEKGARTSLTGNYVRWGHISGADSDADANEQRFAANQVPHDAYFIGNIINPLISKDLSPYKYEDINNYYSGITRNSIGHVGEMYKCSTVGGERAWYGNVKLREGTAGNFIRYGDRVMYSEYRKFDTIPGLNYINVSEGDADDIVELKYFTDKLYIFKSNSVHIWDVSQSNPANWIPKETIKSGGIQHPCSVVDTPYGIIWVNLSGCYYHGGKQTINLMENKLRTTENAYHGSGLPHSWSSFVLNNNNFVTPLIIYSPKEKQIYIMKDPTESGGSEHLCYIYNFETKSWTFNNSIFTDGRGYTNPIIDWNDNVVIAHESDVDTGFNLDDSIAASTTDVITIATNTNFSGSSSNWTHIASPSAFTDTTSGNTRLQSVHPANTNAEGFRLATAHMQSRTANKTYRITLKLHHASGSFSDVEIKVAFMGTTVTLGSIDENVTEYVLDIKATTSTGNFDIFHETNNTVAWYLSSVNVKDITLEADGNVTSKIMPGDRLKLDSENFLVLNTDADTNANIIVKGAYNGTTAASHSDPTDITSSKAVFQQISQTSISTAAPMFITKDYDFDQPATLKKIYKIYITYMNSNSSLLDNKIKVAADGNTTWSQGSISTPHSSSTFALTGRFQGNKSSWDIAVFRFDAPFPCQSIALYFNDGSVTNGISINDISFEYRTIHKRVS